MSYALLQSSNQYLESTASLTTVQNTSFTIACWAKFDDITPATVQSVFSLGNSSYASARYVTLQLNSTGNARAYVAGAATSDTSSVLDGDADARTNAWILMIGRYTVNGSNVITDMIGAAYNGLAYAEDSTPLTGASHQQNTYNVLRIGGSRADAHAFDGDIVHCAVWNKILDTTELTALRTTLPSGVASGNLVVYWPLLTGPQAHTSYGGATFDMTVYNSPTLNTDDGPALSSGAFDPAKIYMKHRV